MRRGMWTKIVLTLALFALILPATGCKRGRGSYTSVDVGFGFLPGFLSGGGYVDSFVEESGYYEESYYEPGYSEGGYYEDEFYWDDWKAKNAGAIKR